MHPLIDIWMEAFVKQAALKAHLELFLQTNQSIGFVPTMGALHQGHLSLLKKSLAENKLTVCSIFVNPTQFNNAEDLIKYPRTLEDDLLKIEALDSSIIVYAPDVDDIYGNKVATEKFDYDGLEHQMEGKQRPGHFDGVGTIVRELFRIVKPTKAYFGEKDYQQVLIVKKMVEKNQLPVQLVTCPILREENGLAMSSRNQRLNTQEKAEASFIYQSLLEAKEAFKTKDFKAVYTSVKAAYENQKNIDLEYFVIADSQSLLEITEKSEDTQYRAFIAVHIGKVRLIDTIALN